MYDVLKDFPLVIELPVAWGEMDSFGHVNNVVYFKYFESCRVAYFEKVGMLSEMTEQNMGPILASTSCTFKAPLSYPDKIFVGARISSLGVDRCIQSYRLVSEKLDRVVAEGEGGIVYYDYGRAKKIAFPEELRMRILGFDPAVALADKATRT